MSEETGKEVASEEIVAKEGAEAPLAGGEGSSSQSESVNQKDSMSSAAASYVARQNYEVLVAPELNLRSLLEAGAHYGHQCHRWNPKMLPYIYGAKNGTHIINLDVTLELWKKAERYLEEIANRGGNILFVGTKPQVREIAKEAAERVGGFSVTQRWLGGTLSNFETIKRSINRMRKLEELLLKAEEAGSTVKINKKERLGIRRELEKLEANLGGIRNMRHVPDVLFVVDVQREAIAVREARTLHIPVVALVDSNVDPTLVDYPIPSNDDASKTLRLFIENAAAAFSRGKHAFFSRGAERAEAASRARRGSSQDRGSERGGSHRGEAGASSEIEVVTRKGSSEKDKQSKVNAEVAVSA